MKAVTSHSFTQGYFLIYSNDQQPAKKCTVLQVRANVDTDEGAFDMILFELNSVVGPLLHLRSDFRRNTNITKEFLESVYSLEFI